MNVANIVLARAMARQREMGIRAALGAGRSRLIRQILCETVLLALLGAIGGVLLGEVDIAVSGSLLHSVVTLSSSLGYSVDTHLDWRVFAYTTAAALFTGVLTGLWPALRASRADVNAILHGGAHGADSAATDFGRRRIRSFLVVAQVAGSLTLLVVAGLFVRSLSYAERMYLGFDPDNVLNGIPKTICAAPWRERRHPLPAPCVARPAATFGPLPVARSSLTVRRFFWFSLIFSVFPEKSCVRIA